MGLIEDITNMKNAGYTDEQIAVALQEQGISPRDINDAFNQSQIKNAVIGQNPSYPQNVSQEFQSPFYPNQRASYSAQQRNREEKMMPSILGPGEENEEREQGVQEIQGDYNPQTMEMPNQFEQYAPYSGEYPEQNSGGYSQEPYSQYSENYPQEAGYSSGGMIDTETIVEISEQVFAEKMVDIGKKIDSMNEFRTIAQAKIEQMTSRLHRIESVIDRLQASILEKVGSYGDDLRNIRKEMSMMQDSFGKVIGSDSEKRIYRKLEEISSGENLSVKEKKFRTSSKKK